jgi:hypothetical protein
VHVRSIAFTKKLYSTERRRERLSLNGNIVLDRSSSIAEAETKYGSEVLIRLQHKGHKPNHFLAE